jgi:hypothetical protein
LILLQAIYVVVPHVTLLLPLHTCSPVRS